MKRLVVFYLSFVLLLAPALVYAGLPQVITDYAVSIKNVVKTGVGVTADFAFKKRAANEPQWAAPAKSVPNTKIAGGFLSRFAKFGALSVGYLVIEKLLEGTDWVMDPENNTITRIIKDVDKVYCTSARYVIENCAYSPDAMAVKWFKATRPDANNGITNVVHSNHRDFLMPNLQDAIAKYNLNNTSAPMVPVSWKFDYTVTYLSNNQTKTEVRPSSVNLYILPAPESNHIEHMTQPELAQYLNDAPVADLETLLQPQPNVDPAQDPAYEELYADAASAAEPVDVTNPDPDPDPDPKPDPDPDPDGETGGSPQTPPEGEPFELPDFCTWASSVCDYIDWVKGEYQTMSDFIKAEPETMPDDPIVVADDPSGLGDVFRDKAEAGYVSFARECPDNVLIPVSLMGASQSLNISYAPFCHFASLIRPAVILGAWISGLLIISGGRARE